MKINVRNEIEELCRHYDVYKYNKKLKKKYALTDAFNRFLEPYDGNEIYIFHSDTLSSIVFYYMLSERNRQKIKILQERNLLKWNMHNQQKIIIDGDDNISYSSKIKKGVMALVYRCKVVNIYEILEQEGLSLGENWYAELGLTYHDIYNDYIKYQKASKFEEKVLGTKRLIGDFLAIRDFDSAKKWLQYLTELCGLENLEVKKYYELWGKIQNYLNKIKNNIESKDHIIVNWIDALRFDEVHNMDFLYGTIYDGICFEKMYTATPYTSATLRTLLTGKHLIDDKLFKMTDKEICVQSKLLHCLRKFGYKFICNSIDFSHRGGIFFNQNLEAFIGIYGKSLYVPSTLIQFESVCRLAEERKNCFMIIHNLGETHAPWLNPINGKSVLDVMEAVDFSDHIKSKSIMEQIIMSQKYFDTQLKYYNWFYDDVRYKIYMSDHGQRRGEKIFDLEGLSHIIFSVCGRDVSKNVVENVTSLIEFPDIIKSCLQNNVECLDTFSKKNYALIQFDDVYSKNLAEKLKKPPLSKRILEFMQYRAIITGEDEYVRLAIGTEFYSRRNCDATKEEKYKKRIIALRKKAGNRYINIEKEKKYEAARAVYQFFDYRIPKEIEFIK